jgi:hypothetical protein
MWKLRMRHYWFPIRKLNILSFREGIVMQDEIKQVDIDKIYRETPLDKIPWNAETPPEALVGPVTT